jgi:predicted GNAT family N-acyltransferase
MSILSFQLLADVPLTDPFFDSLRKDYSGFDSWFTKKANERAYVFRSDTGSIEGFLYLKPETGTVDDVSPPFPPGNRLKIGTFKINPHGTRLGERFMKKAFDHAVALGVDEIYVTVFPKYAKLIEVFSNYGFTKTAEKHGKSGIESVMVRSFRKTIGHVVRDYPLIRRNGGNKFILAIYPTWHTVAAQAD